MKLVRPLLGAMGLIALMLAASAWAFPRLGDQPIAVHFGLNGQADGFAPKSAALLVMPGVALALSVLLAGLPPIMPNAARLERSWGPYVTVWMGVLTLLLAIHLALIGLALGWAVPVPRVVCIGIGLLFAVMGNLLGKVRYNYVFGVRTPWTLSNERVWDRTHRFAGRIMVLAGLVAAFTGILAPSGFDSRLTLVVLVCGISPGLLAVIYSYFESRRVENGAT